MDPDVTVTVDTDEPETPAVVVVEAPEAPEVTAAPEVAEAVGEGIAAGVAAVAEVLTVTQETTARQAEQQFVTEDRLSELLAQALADARPAEPETPTVVLEDDEVVPQYKHPWFKPLHEIRSK